MKKKVKKKWKKSEKKKIGKFPANILIQEDHIFSFPLITIRNT